MIDQSDGFSFLLKERKEVMFLVVRLSRSSWLKQVEIWPNIVTRQVTRWEFFRPSSDSPTLKYEV
jgi:hypothetical protein